MFRKRNCTALFFLIPLFFSGSLFSQFNTFRNAGTSILTSGAPGYSSQEDRYDVSFYFINLDASNMTTFIKGSSTMNATRTALQIDTFVVELSQKLFIDSVFLSGKKNLTYFHENDLLKVLVEEEHKTDTEFQLVVYYQGIAGSGGYFTGIATRTAFPWSKSITYTLSEPFQAKDWFPVKQNLTDKADSSWVFITVDSSLKVGSNGLLRNVKILPDSRKRFEWKSNYPIDYYLISFTAGDYIEYNFWANLNDHDSVFVQNYLYNSPEIESVKSIVDQTAELLKLYSERFGVFPFIKEKYGHCMAPMGGGMEHQTMTTISSFDFGLIAHELAHSWFGDYVTCATWQDIWINEGFASYAEYVALDELKSHEEAVKWLAQAQNLAINYPLGSVFLTPLDAQSVSRIFSSPLSYKKGGAIIHMLRYEINNDSLFFAIIRDYLTEFSHGSATGRDFRRIVEKMTGESYQWFFDQWYYGKGYPVIISSWQQVGDSVVITGSVTSAAMDNAFFKTHLDYKVFYTDGESEQFTVFYDEPEKIFRLKVSKAVSKVQLDPDSNVLKNGVIYNKTDLTKLVTISPNPFKNQLNLTFRDSSKEREINICGLNGKTLLSHNTSSGSLSLDLSFLSKGIYLLNVSEDGKKYTEKILKQ